MKVPYIIGADVSKKTIDFTAHANGSYLKITNGLAGFEQLIEWLSSQTTLDKARVVMEHTGLYSYQLEEFLHSHQIGFSKVSGLAIKKSMGMVRGKSDKQDAKRIARYGFEKTDQLCPAKPVSKSMQRLQRLDGLREKLVRHRASLITAVKEMQQTLELKRTDTLVATQINLIKCYDTQIQKVEHDIQLEIQSQPQITQNYEILQSIIGVGKVLACTTIIKTENFTRFANARKYACFCGTAPFENSSGTSIRKRTRVSHMADKRMKTLLDLGAKSAIQHDKELKEYYQRRIQSGKSKMSTINVVRNKIIYRMFAVIKRQTPYQSTININPTLKN